MDTKVEDTLKKLNIPYVYAVAESLHDYPAVYRFLGDILGRRRRPRSLPPMSRKC
jgi:iron complex transport system substrate-binding protein